MSKKKEKERENAWSGYSSSRPMWKMPDGTMVSLSDLSDDMLVHAYYQSLKKVGIYAEKVNFFILKNIEIGKEMDKRELEHPAVKKYKE